MTEQKVFKSLSTKEVGVYQNCVEDSFGKVRHILIVDGQEREVADSTFKRWWKLVEETVPQETKEPEAELVKQQETKEEVVTELPTEDKPKEKKVVVRKSGQPETAAYFLSRVTANNGMWNLYSEGREGVVKSGGKAVLFFGFVKDGIRIYMKEPLDSMVKCPYEVEEKHSYPRQYPFRFVIPEINDESKELIEEILKLHI